MNLGNFFVDEKKAKELKEKITEQEKELVYLRSIADDYFNKKYQQNQEILTYKQLYNELKEEIQAIGFGIEKTGKLIITQNHDGLITEIKAFLEKRKQ